MQRFFALFLAITMVLTLGACGKAENPEESPAISESENVPAETPAPTPTPTPEETPVPEESQAPEEAPAEEESAPEDDTITGDAELDEMAKLICDSIIKENMGVREKARAVYDFVKGGINYSGTSDKSDWKAAAKDGLKTRNGDCFTYYACARALLTYLGIDNREVRRVDGRSDHWWNLVNCGDGWYHMDATPMGAEMPAFDAFMFTDQQAAQYTELVQYQVGLTNFYSFNGEALPERAS